VVAQLIVITGPIGAGKSTVAQRLAETLSAAGRSTVTVDLDDTVRAVVAPSEDTDTAWHRARVVHGILTGAWLRSGLDAAIVHGPFQRFNQLLPGIPPCEWEFDTTNTSADEIVSTLAEALSAPDWRCPARGRSDRGPAEPRVSRWAGSSA
jgi:hypothetical protein